MANGIRKRQDDDDAVDVLDEPTPTSSNVAKQEAVDIHAHVNVKVPTVSLKTIEKTDIPTQKELRGSSKQVETLAKIPFLDIRVRKEFNKRKDFGDIEELAESIASIGLINPILVDAVKSGDNIIYVLTNGERRFRALQLLHERGKGLEYVEAKLNPRDITELERLVIQMASNNGKPFEPVEEAELMKELRDKHNLEPIAIARSTGHSIAYVEQRLLLADASKEEKELIRKGAVTATVVMEMSRKEKDPEKRIAKITSANEGGGRLKVKDLKNEDVKVLWSQFFELIKDARKNNADDEIVLDDLLLIENKGREIQKAIK